jgi:hypothetical protein
MKTMTQTIERITHPIVLCRRLTVLEAAQPQFPS